MSASWGSRWLDIVDQSSAFEADDLARGEAYARHDWQLDLDIEPGRAFAIARSGPRVSHLANVRARQLTSDEWNTVLGLIAGSAARTAALLDRSLDPALIAESTEAGVALLPRAEEISADCSCSTPGKPCKHAAAVLYIMADAFEEDPFDLLEFRGLDGDAVLARVNEIRAASTGGAEAGGGDSSGSDSSGSGPGGDATGQSDGDASGNESTEVTTSIMPGRASWAREAAESPTALPVPAEPTTVVPWASSPPPRSPFTAAGLMAVAADAASRAHELLTAGPDRPNGSPALHLDRHADLARRASVAEGTNRWPSISASSPFSSQELRARVAAWRVAGAPGIAALDFDGEIRKVDDITRLRADAHRRWYRFEKLSGRWTMTAGPADDPDELLADR